MVNPAQNLARAADLGAAAKAIARDIKTFQQARQNFVTSVRVCSQDGRAHSYLSAQAQCSQHLLQDRLEKEDVSETLKCLMEHNIVGILCCPLTSGMISSVEAVNAITPRL